MRMISWPIGPFQKFLASGSIFFQGHQVLFSLLVVLQVSNWLPTHLVFFLITFSFNFKLKMSQSLIHFVCKSPLSKQDSTNLQRRVIVWFCLAQLLSRPIAAQLGCCGILYPISRNPYPISCILYHVYAMLCGPTSSSWEGLGTSAKSFFGPVGQIHLRPFLVFSNNLNIF